MKKRAKRVPKGTTVRKRKVARPHVIGTEGKGLRVNAIECPACHETLYSRARHDYRTCSCGEVAVDGGFDYIRVAFKKQEPIEKEVWVLVSIKDLYQDWASRADKYGKIAPETCKTVEGKV